jgi:cell division protein ZapA
VKIDILGSSFSVHTDEEPEYLTRIVDYYKQKITEVRKRAPNADALKSAILAGVIVVDELFKERNAPQAQPAQQDAEEASRIAERLIRQLDESLE